MKQGYIKIPICEVWELVNKPWRFYNTLKKEVYKLPLGEYELLDFDAAAKKDIIKHIDKIINNS
jgi:hypothetical protein